MLDNVSWNITEIYAFKLLKSEKSDNLILKRQQTLWRHMRKETTLILQS